MIQASTAVNPPIIENIPEQLTERPQWVNWGLEEDKDGKLTKVPYTPGTRRKASSTDLMTWRTFGEALDAYERGEPHYDGIGYVFGPCPFAGVDLDGCRDPETGVLEEWARELIGEASDAAYVEASPSGTGVHIILRGAVRGGAVKTKRVEMYSRNQFFTVTGRVLS
jgi:primase-polymerase (primpol)-like protein